MGVLYLIQQYDGPVYWYRIPIKVEQDKVQKVIDVLYDKYGPAFVGLYHDPNFVVVYLKPVKSFGWGLIIPAILGMIVGALGYAHLTSQPSSGYSSTFNISNPPGISLSFTDILKLGLIVLIAGAAAYIAVNTYVAYKKVEYLEAERVVPLHYIRENIMEPAGRGAKYLIETTGKGVKYLVKNVGQTS